ncbi:FAD-dependent oxidoreductase, partial [Mesorhizobium sp. M1374]|uniref:FAD-dependent oxidoreductase n=1 Tax=Mesorhizobium sp. M1374 TaxID=2957091 RepID=UPI003339E450
MTATVRRRVDEDFVSVLIPTYNFPHSIIDHVFAHEKHLGYDARHLSSDAIASVTLGIDASAVTPQGAILNPGEGWVDLPSLIEILIAEFVARGGQLVTEAGCATVMIVDGRATGVTTTSGISFAA